MVPIAILSKIWYGTNTLKPATAVIFQKMIELFFNSILYIFLFLTLYLEVFSYHLLRGG